MCERVCVCARERELESGSLRESVRVRVRKASRGESTDYPSSGEGVIIDPTQVVSPYCRPK